MTASIHEKRTQDSSYGQVAHLLSAKQPVDPLSGVMTYFCILMFSRCFFYSKDKVETPILKIQYECIDTFITFGQQQIIKHAFHIS